MDLRAFWLLQEFENILRLFDKNVTFKRGFDFSFRNPHHVSVYVRVAHILETTSIINGTNQKK